LSGATACQFGQAAFDHIQHRGHAGRGTGGSSQQRGQAAIAGAQYLGTEFQFAATLLVGLDDLYPLAGTAQLPLIWIVVRQEVAQFIETVLP